MESKPAESQVTEEAKKELDEINPLEEDQAKEPAFVVTKKGRTTIPVKLRRKYKIEEGTKLEVIDTGEGILLKRKNVLGYGRIILGSYNSRRSECRT